MLPPSTDPTPVDLNRATAEALAAATGLRATLAERIVAHRARFGRFRALEDATIVHGVGPRTVTLLRARGVFVGELEEPAHPPSGAPCPDVEAPLPAPAPVPRFESDGPAHAHSAIPAPAEASPRAGVRALRAAMAFAAALSLAAGAFVAVRAVRADRASTARRLDATTAEVRDAVAAGEARLDDVERRADGLERDLERVDDLATTTDRHGQELAALSGRVADLGEQLQQARARAKVLEGRLTLRELREETTWAWPRPRVDAPASELPPPAAR